MRCVQSVITLGLSSLVLSMGCPAEVPVEPTAPANPTGPVPVGGTACGSESSPANYTFDSAIPLTSSDGEVCPATEEWVTIGGNRWAYQLWVEVDYLPEEALLIETYDEDGVLLGSWSLGSRFYLNLPEFVECDDEEGAESAFPIPLVYIRLKNIGTDPVFYTYYEEGVDPCGH